MLYTAASNAAWAAERGVGGTPYPAATTVAELQAHPAFQVLTPTDCVAYLERLGPGAELQLQPLMGGLAVDVGWASLELFAVQVLPQLKDAS